MVLAFLAESAAFLVVPLAAFFLGAAFLVVDDLLLAAAFLVVDAFFAPVAVAAFFVLLAFLVADAPLLEAEAEAEEEAAFLDVFLAASPSANFCPVCFSVPFSTARLSAARTSESLFLASRSACDSRPFLIACRLLPPRCLSSPITCTMADRYLPPLLLDEPVDEGAAEEEVEDLLAAVFLVLLPAFLLPLADLAVLLFVDAFLVPVVDFLVDLVDAALVDELMAGGGKWTGGRKRTAGAKESSGEWGERVRSSNERACYEA